MIDTSGTPLPAYVHPANADTNGTTLARPDISLFPNPFSSQVTLFAGTNGIDDMSIDVYDIIGRKVYSTRTQVAPGEPLFRRMTIPQLAVGIYFARIMGFRNGATEFVRTQKLLKSP